MTPGWMLDVMVTPCWVYPRTVIDTDVYGDPRYGWTDPIDTVCLYQTVSTSETADGRIGVEDGQLFLPAQLAGRFDGYAKFVVGSAIGAGIALEATGPPVSVAALHDSAIHHVEVPTTRVALDGPSGGGSS